MRINFLKDFINVVKTNIKKKCYEYIYGPNLEFSTKVPFFRRKKCFLWREGGVMVKNYKDIKIK